MNITPERRKIYTGTALAILATIVWSGNFIVARGVNTLIGPVSLAFFRWLSATLLIAPFAWKKFQEEKPQIWENRRYLFWVSLTGIAVFNTLVYLAGHYTTAINLALIGTTSSPVFATLMAVFILKERITVFRILGMLICMAGIILLISRGSWEMLRGFHFSRGDLFILAGALFFALYNILVKKKPGLLSPVNFLFVIFGLGTLLLLPAFIIESIFYNPIAWSWSLAGIIIYLGAGTSVIAFRLWNVALHSLGAARTVLYGNLIPVFSTIEAVLLLDEKITPIQFLSGGLVIAGLIIANVRRRKSTHLNNTQATQ